MNEVVVEFIRGKSQLVKNRSEYPLRIFEQENWKKDYVTLSLLGFGGGMVAGDSTILTITVRSQATLCLKTVGLTNIFKASADKQKECLQTISATIEQDAIFLFLPDPISCYNHAIFKQSQSYRLHHGASLVFIDWYVAGRQGRDDLWGAERMVNGLMLYEEEELVFVESADLRSDSYGSIAQKVGGAVAFGILLLSGPLTAKARKELQCLSVRRSFVDQRRDLLGNRDQHEDRTTSTPWISISNLSNQTTVMRFNVPSAEYGYSLLTEALTSIAPVLKGSAPYSERQHFRGFDPDIMGSQDPIHVLRLNKQSSLGADSFPQS